nr:hypothetical protein [uncultured Roseococcus sp.]
MVEQMNGKNKHRMVEVERRRLPDLDYVEIFTAWTYILGIPHRFEDWSPRSRKEAQQWLDEMPQPKD